MEEDLIMYNIKVEFDKITGKIKPMNAVNNMPVLPRNCDNIYERIQEANIPYCRLHDTGGDFGGTHYVDINNVFPNFDADENDPESYDFAFTDAHLCEMTRYGVKPFYRLGTTIENDRDIKPYNIYPPKDNHKWARICEMIIRHYNEGWADGYHMDIEHWEIWNEPDNFPDIEDNQMWLGTEEEYFELYKTASLHLKKCFPNLKIGGYGSCGFYALSDTDVSETAASSPRFEYFIEFFFRFLEYVRENSLPLDFFSWHSYAGVKDNIDYAKYAREKLDEYGFKDCEVYLNEWNPGTNDRGTVKDASNILSMMCALQNTPTDMCMYYNLRLYSTFCGLFNPLNRDVFPAYYAFYYFGKLLALENQIECICDYEDIYALAAKKNDNIGIIIVNNKNESIDVNLLGANLSGAECFSTDEDKTNVNEKLEKNLISMPPYGLKFIIIKKHKTVLQQSNAK